MMSLIVLDLWQQGPPDGGLAYGDPEVFADQTGDDQRLNRLYSNVSRPALSVHRRGGRGLSGRRLPRRVGRQGGL